MKGSLDVLRVPCRQVLPAGPFDAVLVYNVYPDVDDPQERDAARVALLENAVALVQHVLSADGVAFFTPDTEAEGSVTGQFDLPRLLGPGFAVDVHEFTCSDFIDPLPVAIVRRR